MQAPVSIFVGETDLAEMEILGPQHVAVYQSGDVSPHSISHPTQKNNHRVIKSAEEKHGEDSSLFKISESSVALCVEKIKAVLRHHRRARL